MLKVQLHIFFNVKTFVPKNPSKYKKNIPSTFRVYKIIGKFQVPTQQIYTLVVVIFSLLLGEIVLVLFNFFAMSHLSDILISSAILYAVMCIYIYTFHK